jgi:lipid II isoglutaminyl synthase (glutamine-hydrolysing)
MRFYIALYISKVIHLIIVLLNKGSGFTVPGHFALKIYPGVLRSNKLKFRKGVVIISGTNGKTTTAKLISHILSENGFKIINNETGANLLNGIASIVLLRTSPAGKFDYDYGVFEVDEFALPQVLANLRVNYVVFLNLSRDQLDRYGEVDIIFNRWREALLSLDYTPDLVLYQNQKQFKSFATEYSGKISFFDSDDLFVGSTNLRGDFNSININAAYCVSSLSGISREAFVNSLTSFTSAYGRGELIERAGKSFHIYLAKNPASQNNNLNILGEFNPERTSLLFILNDNIPDGRDVSWIYDVRGEHIFENVSAFKSIYVSGSRCLDMAVRLRYAEIEVLEENITSDIEKAIKMIEEGDSFDEVIVFPNYSAMLQVRKVLTGKAIL